MDVLSRPKLRAKNPHGTNETVQRTFDLLERNTSDGLYQALQPEDRRFALIRGGDLVRRRQVLPFQPPDDIEIALYAERPDLEAAWSAAMEDFENSDLIWRGGLSPSPRWSNPLAAAPAWQTPPAMVNWVNNR